MVEIMVHHFLFVDAKVSTVGADEILRIDPARKALEFIVFDCLQTGDRDLGVIGYLLKSNFTELAFAPQLFSNGRVAVDILLLDIERERGVFGGLGGRRRLRGTWKLVVVFGVHARP